MKVEGQGREEWGEKRKEGGRRGGGRARETVKKMGVGNTWESTSGVQCCFCTEGRREGGLLEPRYNC